MTKQQEQEREATLRKLDVHPDQIADIIRQQNDADARAADASKSAKAEKKADDKK